MGFSLVVFGEMPKLLVRLIFVYGVVDAYAFVIGDAANARVGNPAQMQMRGIHIELLHPPF